MMNRLQEEENPSPRVVYLFWPVEITTIDGITRQSDTDFLDDDEWEVEGLPPRKCMLFSTN